ncbi:MAG: hypothetical protein JXA23_10080, partial [Bacteroidales bacterium]|nr:hypothetical protein [Bacteroidales bacterium]
MDVVFLPGKRGEPELVLLCGIYQRASDPACGLHHPCRRGISFSQFLVAAGGIGIDAVPFNHQGREIGDDAPGRTSDKFPFGKYSTFNINHFNPSSPMKRLLFLTLLIIPAIEGISQVAINTDGA